MASGMYGGRSGVSPLFGMRNTRETPAPMKPGWARLSILAEYIMRIVTMIHHVNMLVPLRIGGLHSCWQVPMVRQHMRIILSVMAPALVTLCGQESSLSSHRGVVRATTITSCFPEA